jgi:hypothetical protein
MKHSALILFSLALVNSDLHKAGYELHKPFKPKCSPPDMFERKEVEKRS